MFTVAIAGRLPEDEAISRLAYDYIRQIKAGLTPEDGRSQLRFAVSPPYTGEEWRDKLLHADAPVCGYTGTDETGWNGVFQKHISFEDPLRETLGEALCDRCDLLLAVWDEDVRQMDGATWELMRIALRKHMPILWISSRTGKTYWPETTSFEPYRPEKLRELCLIYSDVQTEPEPCEKKEFPLLSVGRFFYKRYLRRYKASAKAINAEEDLLLKEDYQLSGQFDQAEPVRRSLLSKFLSFDSAAITLNERYHSALYWRSVLPLITSLIVAVGFYAPSVLAGLFGPSSTVWGIIAGFGFLFHGFLNLYVFILSKSRSIREDREKMIRFRRTAEMLRVLIHFVPFGVHIDLRSLCGDDKELFASLRRIVQETDSETGVVTREDRVEAFRHLDRMLSDQIAYHQLSVERYSRLVKHLDRWSRVIFYVGFCVIILRAFLQFLMSIPNFPLPALSLMNGVSTKSFISSFANMAALLMPAWYSYFATKLSLCNFRFNRDNHQKMIDMLTKERSNAALLKESIDEVPAEALQAIGENLADIMLVKDMSMWSRQYRNTNISHL